jgi:hypothetical protein
MCSYIYQYKNFESSDGPKVFQLKKKILLISNKKSHNAFDMISNFIFIFTQLYSSSSHFLKTTLDCIIKLSQIFLSQHKLLSNNSSIGRSLDFTNCL